WTVSVSLAWHSLSIGPRPIRFVLLTPIFTERDQLTFFAPELLRGTGRPRVDFATRKSFDSTGRARLLARSGCDCVCQSTRRSEPAQFRWCRSFPRICERGVSARPFQSHAVAWPASGSNRWPKRSASHPDQR